MCIICNPALSGALRSLSFKSRRQVLRSAAGGLAGVFVAEAVGPALADGSLAPTLGKGLAPGAATVYVARSIITMERGNPRATAVAVAGGKILAVGSLEQVEAALAGKPHRIDRTFADKILVPGFIDQHVHPILGALTLSVEIVATEDWSLPGRTVKAANSRDEYIARLTSADAALKDPNEWLLTWGY
ncbi:hypothetical protein WDZ92_43560, partial [Nostoc sp. NIES-2111]